VYKSICLVEDPWRLISKCWFPYQILVIPRFKLRLKEC
jgi:hypothetical protein